MAEQPSLPEVNMGTKDSKGIFIYISPVLSNVPDNQGLLEKVKCMNEWACNLK